MGYTTYENIVTEISEGVFTITMSRPKALNALNRATLEELDKAVAEAEANGNAKVLIITGAGEKAFVAGADIAEMSGFTPLEGREFGMLGQRVFSHIENSDKPVIAAVNGYALGGGSELALSCDIRIASENARFGQPEVNLGIIPGFGGTQRLPRLVGNGMANYIILTGEMVSASDALRIGLVEEVVPADRLIERAREIAKVIMKKAPVAVRIAKRAINLSQDVDLASGMSYEAEAFTTTFATSDRIEGMKAFLEKRSASFGGK
ncbi:MAG: enoyl-CoA hydratase/isomerase family protein [Synergistaceae bacterium]|jgi:enoyl-CoA hydratase|nr:enoyl-CoA hydratase/isomerase family protein [Synergistaceae bacterium]